MKDKTSAVLSILYLFDNLTDVHSMKVSVARVFCSFIRFPTHFVCYEMVAESIVSFFLAIQRDFVISRLSGVT